MKMVGKDGYIRKWVGRKKIGDFKKKRGFEEMKREVIS